MSINRLHWAKCPLSFRFHEFEIKVIDRKGKPWIVGKDIGLALGYATKDAARRIRQLYQRNQDEFTEDMTQVIEIEVEAGSDAKTNGFESNPLVGQKLARHTRTRPVRLFSLRGAMLLGMFAKTDVGAQFRDWVLDILESRGDEHSFYRPFKQTWEYECEKHPRWPKILAALQSGDPTARIAERCQCAPSTVLRAIREMKKAGFINDHELKRARETQRAIGRYLREYRAKQQHLPGFEP